MPLQVNMDWHRLPRTYYITAAVYLSRYVTVWTSCINVARDFVLTRMSPSMTRNACRLYCSVVGKESRPSIIRKRLGTRKASGKVAADSRPSLITSHLQSSLGQRHQRCLFKVSSEARKALVRMFAR